jgi:YVTN family beta-propeller protein
MQFEKYTIFLLIALVISCMMPLTFNVNAEQSVYHQSGPFSEKISIRDTADRIVVNPKTNMIYVSNPNTHTVSVINGTTNALKKEIPIYGDVSKIAVNPKTNIIYVEYYLTDRVSVIDGTTNKLIKNIFIDCEDGDIAINPVTNLVFITRNCLGEVSVIDGNTNTLIKNITTTLPHILGAVGLAVNTRTNTLYVTAPNSPVITVVNGSKNYVVTTIPVARLPVEINALAINSKTNKIYWTSDRAGRVFVINGFTDQLEKTIVLNYTSYSLPLPYPRYGLSVDYESNLIYLLTVSPQELSPHGLYSRAANLTVIDGYSNRIIDTVKLDSMGIVAPSDIAVNPVTHMIYFVASYDKVILVMRGDRNDFLNDKNQIATHKVERAGIKIGYRTSGIAINPLDNRIYIADYFLNTISVIDGYSDKVIGTIKLGSPSSAIAVYPITNTIYAGNSFAKSLYVIDGNTNSISSNISLKYSPESILVDPKKNCVDVGYGNNSMTLIDGSTNRVVDNANFPFTVRLKSVDENTGILYGSASNSTRRDGIIAIDAECEPGSFGGPGAHIIYNQTLHSRFTDIYDIAVNPVTSMLYIKKELFPNPMNVSVIDTYTFHIEKDFPIPYSLGKGIAVNPKSNMIYVSQDENNSVAVIDGSTNSQVHTIGVGSNPGPIAVNPITNRIYVGNSDSISVIDGQTNALIAGINFDINPPNSGEIYCNGVRVSNYMVYDVGTSLQCLAKQNSGFAFSSWSGDVNPSDTNDKDLIKFPVSHYGKITANFINPVQFSIPLEIYAAIFGAIVSFLIPSLIGWLNGLRQRKYLRLYITRIDNLRDGSHQTKGEYLVRLADLKREITQTYARGRLSDSHYSVLDDKISKSSEEATEH